MFFKYYLTNQELYFIHQIYQLWFKKYKINKLAQYILSYFMDHIFNALVQQVYYIYNFNFLHKKTN